MNEALSLTGLFIDEGPVVQVKGPRGGVERRDDPEKGTVYAGPLVVLDSHLRASPKAVIVATARAVPTWIITRDDAPHEAQARLEAEGVTVIRVRPDELRRVDLSEALRALGAKGVTRVLCEGGPSLAEALAKASLVDEFVSISSARALGYAGFPALGASLGEAISRNFIVAGEPLALGEDLFIRHVRARVCSPAS